MVEVTKEARQRCVDLAKEIDGQCWIAADFDEGGEVEARAFARYVQQVSDAVRSRWATICSVGCEDVFGNFMLPEPPVDPLKDIVAEAVESCRSGDKLHEAIRNVVAKQGKRLEIVEDR